MKTYTLPVVILTMGAMTLSGCSTKNATPQLKQVQAGTITNANGVPKQYKVKSGDNVGKIANKYGLNYLRIGEINQLDDQYTIYEGQILTLWLPSKKQITTKKPTKATPTPVKVHQQPTNTANKGTHYGSNFIYPTKNKVLKNYSAVGSNGMWFSGKLNDTVYASQSGTVIYAGSGLPEFGNLVMIRHDKELVSAYAHNNKILVTESSYIQRGQKIATMGKTGSTSDVALQFQIRKNGTPVDPRSYIKD